MVTLGHVQSSRMFELPTCVFPAEVNQNNGLPLHFSSYYKQPSFMQAI